MKSQPFIILTIMVMAAMGTAGLASCSPASSTTSTNGSSEMSTNPQTSGKSSFTITIPAFPNGANIPTRYTCSGANVSPIVQFGKPPQGTVTLAVIVEDPDAPGGLFIHWLLYNLAPDLEALPEGIQAGAQVSGIGTQGKSGFGSNGYGGPCPPPGTPHHYHFRAYALDLAPNLPAGLTAAQLKSRINGHVLADADWVGLFQR